MSAFTGCACGHMKMMHQHYRRGTDCAGSTATAVDIDGTILHEHCDCQEYQRKRFPMIKWFLAGAATVLAASGISAAVEMYKEEKRRKELFPAEYPNKHSRYQYPDGPGHMSDIEHH